MTRHESKDYKDRVTCLWKFCLASNFVRDDDDGRYPSCSISGRPESPAQRPAEGASARGGIPTGDLSMRILTAGMIPICLALLLPLSAEDGPPRMPMSAVFENSARNCSAAVFSILRGARPGMTEFEVMRFMNYPGFPQSMHPIFSSGSFVVLTAMRRASTKVSPSQC